MADSISNLKPTRTPEPRCRCSAFFPPGMVCGDPTCPRTAQSNRALRELWAAVRKSYDRLPWWRRLAMRLFRFRLPDLRDKYDR